MTVLTQNKPEEKIKTYDIVLGHRIKVTVDPKSKSRVINFPFELPDGEKAVMIICRLADEDWTPTRDLSQITIHYV